MVGAGPNGLSAAVALARAGLSVQVFEAAATVGGGARSEALTLPGFIHDVCSAIHPLGAISPFWRELDLERRGVEWVEPEIALAHPLEDGDAAVVHRSLDLTLAELGEDAGAYEAMLGPLVEDSTALLGEILRPLRVPRRPLLLARFGRAALRSSDTLAARFKGARARALFAGCAAHSLLPLDYPGSAAFAVTLLLAAHTVGWPIARGGSGRIAKALADCLTELGGEIHTGRAVRSLTDVPAARAVLFDLSPRQVAEIAADALPAAYRRRLARFRHGPGAYKLDWALDGPIPWTSQACRRAGTVHVGGCYEEIAESEARIWKGEHPDEPFVLVSQQSAFDPTRAPAGRHTGWAYTHVPPGSNAERADAVERRIERFAPGFRDRILARRTRTAAELERDNPAMIGGDISGGANTLGQVLARPLARWDPYATPNPRLYLCSASTPPGGGVHGMCGANAARSVLRRTFRRRS